MQTMAQKFRKEGELIGLEKGIQKGMQKGRQEGLQEGIQKGLQKGRYENQTEAACNMIREGVDLKLISKYLGLPLKDLKKLAQQIQTK